LPLWLAAFLLVILPTAAAMGASFGVRRVVALERLATNNEVAGFKFAVLGVIYAVLLGFAVIVVWEKFKDAEAAAVQEAAGVVAISRLLNGLDANAVATVRPQLVGYAKAVIADDWPAMARGTFSPQVNQALDKLYASILAVTPANERNVATMSALLTELDVVTQGRRTRMVHAAGSMPEVLWWVLFVSAFVTLSFTFFFGTRSVKAQALMSGMLAAIIFMALFVVIEINYPFTGPVKVEPDAMHLVLQSIGEER
jgi:hypothetical protein